jgi:hypothetical protein
MRTVFQLITKRPANRRLDSLISVAPAIRPYYKLTRHRRLSASGDEEVWSNEIQSKRSRYFGPTSVRISESTFWILCRSDSKTPLAELARAAAISVDRHEGMLSELFDFWTRRIITCHAKGRSEGSGEKVSDAW